MNQGMINMRCPPGLAMYMQQVWDGEYHYLLPFDGAPTIVDVGACIGVFARWAQAKWPGAELYCYEPNPRVHGMLEANTREMAPRPTIAKAAVVPAAIAREHATVPLFAGRNNVGESSLLAAVAGTESSVDVPTVSVVELPDCDVLKLDCEGREPQLVREYLDTPRRIRPAGVMVEYHSPADASAMLKIAIDYGYRIAKWSEHGAGRGVVGMRLA